MEQLDRLIIRMRAFGSLSQPRFWLGIIGYQTAFIFALVLLMPLMRAVCNQESKLVEKDREIARLQQELIQQTNETARIQVAANEDRRRELDKLLHEVSTIKSTMFLLGGQVQGKSFRPVSTDSVMISGGKHGEVR